MSIFAAAGLVGVASDAILYGATGTSGRLIAFCDACNHVIAYRVGNQRSGQGWISLLLSTIFLKKVAGWISCILRNVVPGWSQTLPSLTVLIIAFIACHATPNDVVYKTLREPACARVLSLGGALYRWRKLLYSADTFSPSWLGIAVTSLLVDGTSIARNIHKWFIHRSGSSFPLRGAGLFILKRMIPTWGLFFLVQQGRNAEINLGVWAALLFYLYSFGVFLGLNSITQGTNGLSTRGSGLWWRDSICLMAGSLPLRIPSPRSVPPSESSIPSDSEASTPKETPRASEGDKCAVPEESSVLSTDEGNSELDSPMELRRRPKT